MKHLRYFEALAQQCHFGRAAEQCAISQPALSVQIKELEEILCAPLVERGPREVRLTSLGEAFALRARDILRAVDELGDLARASQKRLFGRLRIGVIPTIAPYLLPRFVNRLARLYPELEIHPYEAVTQKLIARLLDGQIDAAIVALPVSEPSLEETALFQEEFALVRPLQDAQKPVPDAEHLARMRLLLLEEGHCFREQALSFCSTSGALPRELMEASSLSTLVQLVGAGIGVTLIPEMAVSIETRSAPVAVARLKPPRPTRTVGMVWRRSSPLAEQFTRVAQALGKDAQVGAAVAPEAPEPALNPGAKG